MARSPEWEEPVSAPPLPGARFGLRGQLLFALGTIFVLSFSLLAIAAVQLTRRSAAIDRARDMDRVATLVADQIRVVERIGGGPADLDGLLRRTVATGAAVAVRHTAANGSVTTVGRVPDGPGGAAPTAGGRLEVWSPTDQAGGGQPLRQLLIFYVALTAAAVLLFAFVLLTFLIVRPLEAVTRSSERLAAGDLNVRVPLSGAAEVIGLARSFNRMAGQLRRDREDLEHRLRELERTTDALYSAQAQLVHGEKLASVGRLSAGIAHEIGNPLAAIVGLVELVQGGTLTTAQNREFLERIRAETERINGIIRNLLDFSRGEPDDHDPPASADLRAVVEDAVALVRPQKDSRRVRIEVAVPADLPPVRASAPKLTQVVLNLLLNALDALSGQGVIAVRAEPVEAGRVALEVRDDGPGIDPAMLDRLFEPFTTTKPVGQGTGLGLAVVHGLVERMGGTLRADNAEGGGARFRVEVPIASPGTDTRDA